MNFSNISIPDRDTYLSPAVHKIICEESELHFLLNEGNAFGLENAKHFICGKLDGDEKFCLKFANASSKEAVIAMPSKRQESNDCTFCETNLMNEEEPHTNQRSISYKCDDHQNHIICNSVFNWNVLQHFIGGKCRHY